MTNEEVTVKIRVLREACEKNAEATADIDCGICPVSGRECYASKFLKVTGTERCPVCGGWGTLPEAGGSYERIYCKCAVGTYLRETE